MSEQAFHIGIKGLIRNDKGQLLLLSKKHIGDMDKSRVAWDIPGGRMDIGEDFEDTLAREIKEELGIEYDTKPEFFVATKTNIKIPSEHGELSLVLMFHHLKIPNDAKITLSDEHLGYEWVDVATAADRLRRAYSDRFAEQLKLGLI
jgi:8-oxo-dGTP pyrophosphatase MutT (NUDIX family)